MMSSTSFLTTIVDPTDNTSPFMLPGMAEPEQLPPQIDAGSRVVRFDEQCVLIPENPKPKRPMVVTRSYTLPLWKRKGSFSDLEASEDSVRSPSARSSSPENNRVVIKVPIPTFKRRSSRSPTRGRTVSMSPLTPNKLTPCLIHRDPSISPEVPNKVLSVPTRPSLPIYQRRKDDITVPLRECCQTCERITEECIREGDLWEEKFSRGARRRRSMSWDHHDSLAHMPLHHVKTNNNSCKVFSEVVTEDEPLDLDVEPARPCEFSLTVDEVDKRRKSLDLSVDHHDVCGDGSPPSPTFQSHQRDVSSSSTASSTIAEELIPDIFDSRHRFRSSPIQEEEDEAQLFPLPRRTPSGTPSPKSSPSPSPNGSTACLASSIGGVRVSADRSGSASSSRESVASKSSSSHESVLKASLSRRPPAGVGLGFSHHLSPHVSTRMSPLASAPAAKLEATSRRERDLPPLPEPTIAEDTKPQTTPYLSMDATSSSITGSLIHSSPSSSSILRNDSTATLPADESPPLPPPPQGSISPTSPSLSPSGSQLSSSSSFQKRKFTAPFIKAGGALKGVGAEVLKGVGTMGGSGASF